MSQTIYGIGAPATEVKRLRELDWPNLVSEGFVECISSGINITSLLDAGCGPGTQMAETCQKLGIAYTGFDNGKLSSMWTTPYEGWISSILRRNLNEKGLKGTAIYADVLDVTSESFEGRNPDPRNNDLYDIVHMRFVLMHLMSCDWDRAIINMIKLSLKRVILMEYDWQSVTSKSHPKEIAELVELFQRFATLVNLDLYAGRKLKQIAERGYGYPANYSVSSRPEGKFVSELLSKIPSAISIAKQLGKLDLAEAFEKKMDEINSIADEITITPAQIHSLIIDTSVPRKRLA